MKKIVITGGAGFIGSHIVNYFYNNYKKSHIVVIDKLTYAGNLNNLGSLLSNKRIKFVKADIGNYKIMKDALSKTDLLINAAAESHVDNSYGNSKLKGFEGFQQSLLKSLYRSLKDKRKMICEDYGDVLKECGGTVRFFKSLGDKSRNLWERLKSKKEKNETKK